MLISTRGRYVLRVMLDLAEREAEKFVPLKEIAARQGISQKYMESIMTTLSKNNFVEAIHGRGGGYRLNRAPSAYRVGDILRLAEGSLAPVSCLECNAPVCPRESACKTLPMWKGLYDLVNDYFDGITLQDLIQ